MAEEKKDEVISLSTVKDAIKGGLPAGLDVVLVNAGKAGAAAFLDNLGTGLGTVNFGSAGVVVSLLTSTVLPMLKAYILNFQYPKPVPPAPGPYPYPPVPGPQPYPPQPGPAPYPPAPQPYPPAPPQPYPPHPQPPAPYPPAPAPQPNPYPPQPQPPAPQPQPYPPQPPIPNIR